MKPAATLPGWPARMRVAMAAAYLGVSPTQLRRMVAAGHAPAARPVPGSPGVRAWLKADLDAHLAGAAPGGVASPSVDLFATG